jgi:alpha-tubulin suppressor-like RCC1 family protein
VYFNGDAPSVGSQVFEGDNQPTVYYLPRASGWGPTFGGCPTVLWNPEVQTIIATWGAGTTNAGLSPDYGQRIQPIAATNIIGIAAGGFHSLALTFGGRVVAWGRNSDGQTNVSSAATNVILIAAGDRHSLVLRSNGTLVTWGDNSFGQISIPVSAINVTAIAAGWYHNLAITNGMVVAWGAGTTVGSSPNFGQSIVPSTLSEVVAVAGGGYHSLALQADGNVVGWGLNDSGQTDIPSGLSNVVAIAAGGSNSLALRADGVAVGWGDNTFGQTNIPVGLVGVVAIAAGGNSCIALTTNGSLISWGDNSFDQTNAPLWLTNIVAMAAGRSHSMALVSDGALLLLSQPESYSVTNGATVRFKVSAFGCPPISYQWRRDETNLTGVITETLVLTNVQYSHEGSYSVVVGNLAHAITSSNGVLNVFDINEALNTVGFVWTNGGSSAWLPQTYAAHDGVAAIAGGPLIYGQPQSVIGTTIAGPGTLTFWWQGTSPYSSLKFYIDGALQASLSFGGSWAKRAYHLGSGNHSLSWTAMNSWSSSSTGTAYLDEVIFTPDPVPLKFDVSSLYTSNGGFMLVLTGLSGHGPVIIYSSTNLTDWNPIYTNPPQIGSLQLLDSSATNRPAQFYRAQEQ